MVQKEQLSDDQLSVIQDSSGSDDQSDSSEANKKETDDGIIITQ